MWRPLPEGHPPRPLHENATDDDPAAGALRAQLGVRAGPGRARRRRGAAGVDGPPRVFPRAGGGGVGRRPGLRGAGSGRLRLRGRPPPGNGSPTCSRPPTSFTLSTDAVSTAAVPRMQLEATDVFDVSREPAHVLPACGGGPQDGQLLMARRLVERGVRFVQTWHGTLQHPRLTRPRQRRSPPAVFPAGKTGGVRGLPSIAFSGPRSAARSARR
jgi:hypothetical protein